MKVLLQKFARNDSSDAQKNSAAICHGAFILFFLFFNRRLEGLREILVENFFLKR